MRKILLTGIPSSRIFYFDGYRQNRSHFLNRRKEIRTYSDIVEDLSACGNTGNLLIGEGAQAAISEFDSEFIPFYILQDLIEDEDCLSALRQEFTHLVLATANILRADLSADEETRIINALDLPTVVIGAGIQNQDILSDTPPSIKNFVRCLADNGHFVFARGETTKEFLINNGVSNVVATGCPSLYVHSNEFRKALRQLGRLDLKQIHNCILGGYLGHAATNQDVMFINKISKDVSFVLQDEFIHYGLEILSRGRNRRDYNATTGEIYCDYNHPDALYGDAKPKIHIFTDTDDWRRFSKGFDFYFGCRFHGGIIAMQAGVPAVFVAMDARMKEMLDLVGIPYLDRAAFLANSREDRFDFDRKLEIFSELISNIDHNTIINRYTSLEETFRSNVNKLFG